MNIKDYKESARAVASKLGELKPEILMILGSGLGDLADEVENKVVIDYKDIPNFAVSTAPGHKGSLVCGTLGGKQVMVMAGRVHYYEGYEYDEITLPIRVARLIGVKTLFVTNAAGGINRIYNAGEFMLISDHIKLCGDSPLRGENPDELGPRFPDMSYVYSENLRGIVRETAKEMDIPLHEGVYYYAKGPQYESPAEIRAMGILGADAVGMSTVPEVITARHCGMEIVGISLISNLASGISEKPLSGEEVIEAGIKAKSVFAPLVIKCLEKM